MPPSGLSSDVNKLWLRMNKRYQTLGLLFEWDTNKAQRNQQKHGITFEQATEVFYDTNAVFDHDTPHSYYEDRFTLLGMIRGNALALVVFVENDIVRIISARKATKEEAKRYAEQR